MAIFHTTKKDEYLRSWVLAHAPHNSSLVTVHVYHHPKGKSLPKHGKFLNIGLIGPGAGREVLVFASFQDEPLGYVKIVITAEEPA